MATSLVTPSPSYLTSSTLATLLSSPSSSSIAIIDVRDDDHVGGHIKGSLHVPSSTLDYRLPELVRTLAEKEKIVFHCALSQQRGPAAARGYLRERERMRRGGGSGNAGEEEEGKSKEQHVFILEGGFTGWQRK